MLVMRNHNNQQFFGFFQAPFYHIINKEYWWVVNNIRRNSSIRGSSMSINHINSNSINNGYLYKLSGNTATKIGTSNEWTFISGWYNTNSLMFGFGICDNKLYKISNTTVTLIDDTKNWIKLSLFCF